MARRSRRRRSSPSRANPRSYSGLRPRVELEQGQPEPPRSEPRPAVEGPQQQPAPAGTSKAQADWRNEYSRVFTDLKQLLVVSVALFALMLVVGFFL